MYQKNSGRRDGTVVLAVSGDAGGEAHLPRQAYSSEKMETATPQIVFTCSYSYLL
jgi:hypothetical protein